MMLSTKSPKREKWRPDTFLYELYLVRYITQYTTQRIDWYLTGYTTAMRSVLIAAFALLPFAASAQFINSFGNTSPFTLSIDPQYPAPFTQATISVQSDSLDLANAAMTISLAGKNIYQGNVKPTAFTLGKAGSIAKVNVTLTVNGASYTQSVTIQPQDVALVAEPISSVPPLYPGKSLVPLEGDTRVVAVASFRTAGGFTVNPSALSYSWTVDDTRIASASGIGKSAVIVASPIQYRVRTVSVAITSQDGSLVGGGSLSLSPQTSSVRIYESDPLLGIRFERALTGTHSITGAESTLYAAPFSLPLKNGAPLIQWFLNGSSAQTGSSITLRPTGSGQGSSSLSLTASAASQTAAASLPIIFGDVPGSNFFGL